MFNQNEWEDLIPTKKYYDEEYIFAYFLGNNPEQKKSG